MKKTIYAKINDSFFTTFFLEDESEIATPTGFVLMAENRPDSNYIALDNGDGTGIWVIDEKYWEKQNQTIVDALKLKASQEIETLQDAIDLDMSLEGDEDKLKSWKKYRVLLSRADTNVENMELPEIHNF